MFRREIGERRESEFVQNCLEVLFLQNEGSGGIYIGKMPFRLLVHLERPLATLLTLVVFTFSWFNFGCIFVGLFQTHIELILVSLESYGCLVSRTLKKLKIQRSD